MGTMSPRSRRSAARRSSLSPWRGTRWSTGSPPASSGGIFGAGLVGLAGFLLFQRAPDQCGPGEDAGELMNRKSEGKGMTVIEAEDGTVHEVPSCWRLRGVLVGSTVGSRVGAWLPSDLMEKALGGVFAVAGFLALGLQLSG